MSSAEVMEALLKPWFAPLFLSPIFALEVLCCFAFFRRSTRILFLFYVVAVLVLSFALQSPDGKNKAIWSTFDGFVEREALRPRAVFPKTAVIQVKATALNPADHKAIGKLAMTPFVRWISPQSPAYDVAGVIVDVNPDCGFKVGDAVFGQGFGGVQEFSTVFCPRLARIPKGVSFVQAAGSATVMATALHGFRDRLKEKDTLLIVGASGGCGLAASSIAKTKKVGKIYCIASAKNHEEVKSYGCDVTYDYGAPDFESRIVSELKGKVDLVYDAVSEPLNDYYFNLLAPTLKQANGKYVGLNPIVKAYMSSEYRDKFSTFLATPTKDELHFLEEHPELFRVKIAATLDGLNPTNVKKAYDMLKSHRTVGKIVLTIGDQNTK